MDRVTWSSEDDAYLREHASDATQQQLAEALQRTTEAVRRRCYMLGILRPTSFAENSRDQVYVSAESEYLHGRITREEALERKRRVGY